MTARRIDAVVRFVVAMPDDPVAGDARADAISDALVEAVDALATSRPDLGIFEGSVSVPDWTEAPG